MTEGNHQRELGGALGPVTGTERISALDTMRGFALLGILLMNIVGFGLPFAYSDPTNYGGADGANLGAWIMNNMLFEGTMRGIFSMLFGAGIVLMTGRAEAAGGGLDVADIYYRRTLWLFAFGVIHSWLLLWTGDILYWYGLAGLFLFAFRKLNPRTLIILGLLCLASIFPKDLHELNETQSAYDEAMAAQVVLDEGGTIDEEQQDAIDAWDAIVEDEKPTPERIQKLIDGKTGNYFEIIATNAPRLVWIQSKGQYLFAFWDAAGMMLIGMALIKLGVLTAARSKRFYLALMLGGYAVGLSVNAYETNLLLQNDFGIFANLKANLTYELGRLPTALGHIGLVMLVVRLGWIQWLTRRLAAVGRMALTNYVSHTVVCAILFSGIGFSLFGDLQRYQLYYVVITIWIVQLLISPIWLRHFRYGPLEWLWRSLTYNKMQPMRRTVPVTPVITPG